MTKENKSFALTPEEFSGLNPYDKYIASFGMNETHKKQCWNELVKRFDHVEDAENFKEFISADEEKFMLTLESLGYEVRNSKGNLSMNTAMPSSTYRSAKSVFYKALKAGVKVVDDEGKPKGKTAVERETKSVTTSATYDPPVSMDECVDKFTKDLEKTLSKVDKDLSGRTLEFLTKVKDVVEYKMKDEEVPF